MSIRMWVGVESLRTIEPELKTVRKGSLEFIYFIQGGPKHPIKIGKTRDLLGRLSTIQCSYPVGPLGYIGLFLAPAWKERWIHARFAPLKIQGEWFKPIDPLMSYIQRKACVTEEFCTLHFVSAISWVAPQKLELEGE